MVLANETPALAGSYLVETLLLTVVFGMEEHFVENGGEPISLAEVVEN